MKKNILLLLCLVAFFTHLAHAADTLSYDLRFTIKGLKTPTCLLGYYQGEKTFAVDTAQADTTTGFVRFRKNKRLLQGVYFVAAVPTATDSAKNKNMQGGILIDFMLTEWRDFSIQTVINAPYDSAMVERSSENAAYFAFMRQYLKTLGEINQINESANLIRKATKDPQALETSQKQLQQKNLSLDMQERTFLEKYPDHLFAQLLKANRLPTVPDSLKPFDEQRRPNRAYRTYLRQHFWDNFDFTEERLLQSKVFVTRFRQYLEQTTPQHPDSLRNAIDDAFEQMRPYTIFYRYALRWLTERLDASFDAAPLAETLFVHLVENYHQDTVTSGTDPATWERLHYKSELFKPTLIGKVAPEIELLDTAGVKTQLSQVYSPFTLVIFYSALCSHCQAATPKIDEAYAQYKGKGVQFFAVCTDPERSVWKDYVTRRNWTFPNVAIDREHSKLQDVYAAYNLPVFYLLDARKRIIAKRFAADKLSEVLGKFLK